MLHYCESCAVARAARGDLCPSEPAHTAPPCPAAVQLQTAGHAPTWDSSIMAPPKAIDQGQVAYSCSSQAEPCSTPVREGRQREISGPQAQAAAEVLPETNAALWAGTCGWPHGHMHGLMHERRTRRSAVLHRRRLVAAAVLLPGQFSGTLLRAAIAQQLGSAYASSCSRQMLAAQAQCHTPLMAVLTLSP